MNGETTDKKSNAITGGVQVFFVLFLLAFLALLVWAFELPIGQWISEYINDYY